MIVDWGNLMDGDLEELLLCIDTVDLARFIASPVPPKKAARAARVRVLIAEGVVDFRAEIIDLARKPELQEMCDVVGVDAEGTVPVLKQRLGAWYEERYRGKKPTSSSSDRRSQQHNSGGSVEQRPSQPQSVARSVAAMPAAEREFLEVTSASDGGPSFLGAIGLGGVEKVGKSIADALAASSGAPIVVQVRPSEVASFKFDEGVPRVGGIYVRHPIDPDRYIRAEDATERIAREKLLATIEIAGLLGATRIEVMQDESTGASQNVGADLAVLGREIGFDVATSGQARTANRLVVTWPASRRSSGGIPPSKQPYLSTMPELGMLARMVDAGQTPDQMHQDVNVEFKESQEIAARLKKIPKIGSLSAKLSQQSFVTTRWTLRIWFTPKAAAGEYPTQTPSSSIPTHSLAAASGPHSGPAGAQPYPTPAPPAVIPGAPCATCHAALIWVAQYQRWFCAHCQRYAAT